MSLARQHTASEPEAASSSHVPVIANSDDSYAINGTPRPRDGDADIGGALLITTLDKAAPVGVDGDPKPGAREVSERGRRVDVAWSLHERVAATNFEELPGSPAGSGVQT